MKFKSLPRWTPLNTSRNPSHLQYQNQPGDACIITGCDSATDWLLEWWYLQLRKHTRLPIIFADFGMRPEVRRWASRRGVVTDHPSHGVCGWFQKPRAILSCDYQHVLWLDNDCEIVGPIKDLFSLIQQHPDTMVAAAPDRFLDDTNPGPNTGVVYARHGSQIISIWAEACNEPGSFRGDQEILTQLIQDGKIGNEKILMLPTRFNKLRLDPDQSGTPGSPVIIKHHTGNIGKDKLNELIVQHQQRWRLQIPVEKIHRAKRVYQTWHGTQ